MTRPGHAVTREWWRDAVVYQVYPRSFADGNGDGVGDLRGIIARLDHLAALGVDAVWMSPCYPSPQHDHGYDVADYFDINPEYGTLDDFDELVAGANARGIRIMLDVVPNHCSVEHQWFRAALAAGRGSAARDRFWFRDGRGDQGDLPPNNWTSLFGGSAWTRVVEPDGSPGQWYLHVFDSSQPDFNWENPEVAAHFDDMLTFWFDRGVDGFRVDAVTVVGKTEGLPDAPEPPPGTKAAEAAAMNPHFIMKRRAHDYWRRWRSLINDYEASHPGRQLVTISEAYTPLRPDMLLRYVMPDQFHQSFAFDLMLAPWIPSFVRRVVRNTVDTLLPAGASLTWTLNNHDTQRAVTRYGRADAALESSWTANNLVYTETPVDLALGTTRARAMIAFAAALPGSLYLYQGEELGLPEWLDLPDERREDPVHRRSKNPEHAGATGVERGRDGCRVPLPWTSDASTNFGFSAAPADSWLPQPPWWGDHAASVQHGVPGSMLEMYRRMITLRRGLDPHAPLEWIMDDSDEVVAFRRGTTLVVLNMSDNRVSLPAGVLGDAVPVFATGGGSTADVEPNSTVWYQR